MTSHLTVGEAVFKRKLRGASLLLAVITSSLFATLTGCRDDSIPANEVPYTNGLQGVWREMMSPYGFYPVFPVRTNIQPGDVWMVCDKNTVDAQTLSAIDMNADPGSKTEWIRVFALKGVPGFMKEWSTTRMAYNAFPTAVSATSSEAQYGPMSNASSPDPYDARSAPATVGFASFPSVLSYSRKRSDLGIGTAAGVVAFGIGSAKADQSYYSLEIPAAELAEMPLTVLQKSLNATAAMTGEDADVLTKVLSHLDMPLRNCYPKSISVVYQVLYTRHLTATMGDSHASAISARAAVELPADSTRKKAFDALSTYISGVSAPAAPVSSPLPSIPADDKGLAKLVIDLDKIYQEADANSKLGFNGVKIGRAKDGGKAVSMDYRFSVPVAFAVSLMSISVDSKGKLSTIIGGATPVEADAPKPGASAPTPATVSQADPQIRFPGALSAITPQGAGKWFPFGIGVPVKTILEAMQASPDTSTTRAKQADTAVSAPAPAASPPIAASGAATN